MQLYTTIEQGLEQIHYDSRFTAYLITRGNLQEEGCRRKIFSKYLFKNSKWQKK